MPYHFAGGTAGFFPSCLGDLTIRTFLSALFIFVAVLPLASCDPCSGVSVCNTERYADVTGVIVDRTTGRGMANVRVTIELLAPKPLSGPGVVSAPDTSTSLRPTASMLTDGEGRWRLRLPAPLDTVRVDVTVAPPALREYHVRELSLRASTGAGDAHELGAWAASPYGRRLATISYRGAPLAGATVTFRPTRGELAGPSAVKSLTNGVGIFQLLMDGSDAGNVIGELLIQHPSLPKDLRIFGFRVPVEHEVSIGAPVGLYAAEDYFDPSFFYGGQVTFRGNGQNVPGAIVSFVRTGGIDINPRQFQTVSGDEGFFLLEFHPLGDGTVIGDVTITPPDGRPPEKYRDVAFAAYDSTSKRYTGLWGYGYRWAWAIELDRNDQLIHAPDVRVRFRRTGGLGLVPESIDTRSGPDGRILLQGVVPDSGIVEGELDVFPASGPQRLITGLRLGSRKASEVQFAGVFGFGPALRYYVQVQRVDGTPVAGASVNFAQTSGITVSPTSASGVTDSQGRFAFALIPSTDGRVTGTFRVTPPAPWPPGTVFTFPGTNLDTFESGETRAGPRLILPSP